MIVPGSAARDSRFVRRRRSAASAGQLSREMTAKAGSELEPGDWELETKTD
jgi:hypothetical protein